MSSKEQATEQQNHFTLGIDVGGTKIAAGLVDTQGKILYQARVPMPAREDADAGFAALESPINPVFAAQPQPLDALAGIGICAPGPLEPIRGIALNPPD